MTRVFVRLSILLAFVACLIVGVTHSGAALIPAPESATVQPFDCTPKPCWHGIHTGMPIAEVVDLLRADPTLSIKLDSHEDRFVCWTWLPDTNVAGSLLYGGCYYETPLPQEPWMWLGYARNQPRLGDVLLRTGRPTSSFLCTEVPSSPLGTITTADGIDIGLSDIPRGTRGVDPSLRVGTVTYYDPESMTWRYLQFHWRGFARWSFTATLSCLG